MQQPLVLNFRNRRSWRDLLGRRDKSLTPSYSIVTPTAPASQRDEPVLVFRHDDQVPTGDFASEGVANARLMPDMVPNRGAWWESVEEFALTYDGYAYWNDVSELGNRAMESWTRDHTLPLTMHELRGCLFYEQRRWHHFGDQPSGRGAEYVWALLDAIRSLLAFAAAAPVPAMARTAAPVVMIDPPSLPAPPVMPPPPAAAEIQELSHAVAVMAEVALAAPLRPASAPARPVAVVAAFADDDDGFLAWIQTHGSGFVLNASKGRSVKGLKLHRASCGSIAAAASSTRSWTAKFRKVCADDVSQLLSWCLTTFEAEPDPCQRCQP